MNRFFTILFSILACSLVIASVVILAILLVRVGGQNPRVKVTCGILEGKYDLDTDTYSFKGIPYAKPPVNDLRWKVPEELSHDDGSCWSGIRSADKYGSECAQINPAGHPIGSEDCLYLDIYTPSIESDAGLPVMVFIHGGYLRFGNGSWYGYAPNADITKKLQVVFVSIQYRLNAFGFLVLDVLNGSKANLGIRDQIQALKWIQQNIRNFGGNPNDVTLMGQSSGGSSVLILVASPMGKGYFHKAWSMSASSVLNTTMEEAAQQNLFFINNTHCHGKDNLALYKCLYNLSSEEILHALYHPEWNFIEANNLPTKGYFENPLPVVDGEVLMAGLKESFEDGKYVCNNVTLIIGTTAQEIDNDPKPGHQIIRWKTDEVLYTDYISSHLNPFGESITSQALAYYPYKGATGVQPEYSFTSMASDVRINCPQDVIAKAASQSVKSVYRYVVVSRPSSPVYAFNIDFPANYSLHGWDMFAFYDTMHVWMRKRTEQSDTLFAKNLQEEIMTWVHTGKPKSETWKPYPATTALLNQTTSIVDRYNKKECDWWLAEGFFKYGWMN